MAHTSGRFHTGPRGIGLAPRALGGGMPPSKGSIRQPEHLHKHIGHNIEDNIQDSTRSRASAGVLRIPGPACYHLASFGFLLLLLFFGVSPKRAADSLGCWLRGLLLVREKVELRFLF